MKKRTCRNSSEDKSKIKENSSDILNKFSISFHKMIYPLLKPIFRLLRKHEFIYVNQIPQINDNTIFALNHSNVHDIPYTCELLSRHCYILVGKQPLEPIDRLAFILNGAVWVDRKSRTDKNRAVAKMIKLLCNGANLVIFPEGTWNLTCSKPMLPLYWGIIDIAKVSGKSIIPVILEYTDDKCYVAFGERMQVLSNDDKGEKICELKDQFATLKWSIWEQFDDTGCYTADEWNAEAAKRLAEYPKTDCAYEATVVRKEYDTVEEVFGHLNRITPDRTNAFLFNKQNHL